MTTFTFPQLEQLWINAGGGTGNVHDNAGQTLPLPELMAAIAEAESRGVSTATGGVGEEGLWQINPAAWPGRATYDPAGNAQSAVYVYTHQGLSAWSTYNHGDYVSFLSSAAPSSAGLTAQSGGLPIPGLPGSGIIPGVPTLPIPGLGGAGSILDPNTLIQDIGQTILKSLGLPSFKDLFQRLGLILLGAVIMFIGIQMLTRGVENKILQPPSANPTTPSGSSEELTPAEEESATATGAGASGTAALSSEALEAAAIALWLAHLSTLSALV